MSDGRDFTQLVPGFDFLQNLAQGAGAAMPGFGQWVAPTLDPDEIDKRIKELRTVQFWLEQNARLLATTIQALEVQRMTLSTLKTMNVQMGDLRDSLKIKVSPAGVAPSPSPAPAAPSTATKSPAGRGEAKAQPAAAGVVDPMQWWGALTKQFAQIATTAMKNTPAEAAAAMATSLVKPSPESAAPAARKASGSSRDAAAKPARRKSPRRRAAAQP